MSHRRLIESVALNSLHPETCPRQPTPTSGNCSWEPLICWIYIGERKKEEGFCISRNEIVTVKWHLSEYGLATTFMRATLWDFFQTETDFTPSCLFIHCHLCLSLLCFLYLAVLSLVSNQRDRFIHAPPQSPATAASEGPSGSMARVNSRDAQGCETQAS